MRDDFSVRRATVDDIRTIIGMFGEAAAWLATKDTKQWAKPWPSATAHNARIERGVQNHDTWIVEHFGEPVATITYRKHGNQKLWTAQELRDPAVYACRLIVSRRWAGNEIGAALIDWAGYQALQAWKARWIRIDVWKDNFALHNYYEKYGFAHVRTWQFDDPGSSPSTALFQKPTAEVDEVAATQFSQAIVGPLEQDKTSRPPTTEESLPRSAEPRAQDASKAPSRGRDLTASPSC